MWTAPLLQVKITDFGSSSICDGDGHQGKSFAKGPVGTPPYIAPELLFPGVMQCIRERRRNRARAGCLKGHCQTWTRFFVLGTLTLLRHLKRVLSCNSLVLRHGGWHGFPVDDWSLGISLFVMLNGYFPWKEHKHPVICSCSVTFKMGQ